MTTTTATDTGAGRTILPRETPSRTRTFARAGIAGAAGLTAFLAVQSAAGSWLSGDHPMAALHLAPGDARVELAAALALSGSNAATAGPRARALAGAALERDVTDPRAIEFAALAADAAGDSDRAARLFHLSDAISRRSLPTRLWLIQSEVDRGDVLGALRHFDIALRTSTDAPPVLFPVLARATADPNLAGPIAAMLDRPSDWRQAFFNRAIAEHGPAAGLASAALKMRDRRWLVAHHIDDNLIARLVSDGDYRLARTVATAFRPGREAPGALIRDPGFDAPSARYPFGWQLQQNGNIEAVRAKLGRHSVLRHESRMGAAGTAATQLLLLNPGSYRLAARTAQGAADPFAQPFWTLTCAGEQGRQIAILDQSPRAGAGAAADFSVPVGCEAQWLNLHLRGSDSFESQQGAISAVYVQRR